MLLYLVFLRASILKPRTSSSQFSGSDTDDDVHPDQDAEDLLIGFYKTMINLLHHPLKTYIIMPKALEGKISEDKFASLMSDIHEIMQNFHPDRYLNLDLLTVCDTLRCKLNEIYGNCDIHIKSLTAVIPNVEKLKGLMNDLKYFIEKDPNFYGQAVPCEKENIIKIIDTRMTNKNQWPVLSIKMNTETSKALKEENSEFILHCLMP